MSLKFLDKIDSMILDMDQELKKIRKARVKPNHHIGFVNERINEEIRQSANSYPDDPVKSLGHALSRVGDLITESFDHLETVERNIIVTISAYNRVKEALVVHENELKQQEGQGKVENSPEHDVESDADSKPRKPGTRPVDKLAKRKASAKNTEKAAPKKRGRKKKAKE